ncbi:MAG TPA: hypothetical protein VHN98_01345 [Acidimicrobiales bacterium]|nr:hypothetical protein [Acidimicrobiales bacterium]
MNERLRSWHPRPDEVRRIIEEMRPVIRELVEIERARCIGDALCALTPAGGRAVALH